MVVLPEDSGPKISMTRPRGTPPTPSAASNEIEPVEMVETGATASLLPRRIIEPLPNCFSICERASSTARVRSSAATILLQFRGGCVFNFGKCTNLRRFYHSFPYGRIKTKNHSNLRLRHESTRTGEIQRKSRANRPL